MEEAEVMDAADICAAPVAPSLRGCAVSAAQPAGPSPHPPPPLASQSAHRHTTSLPTLKPPRDMHSSPLRCRPAATLNQLQGCCMCALPES